MGVVGSAAIDALLIAVGAVLLALVAFDVLVTTLRAGGGAGPLTRYLLSGLWRGLLRVHRRDSRSRLLGGAGAGLLALTVLAWVAGLWTGWSLIFLGSDGAVVDAGTGRPAGTADVFYYAGFTVFTLGVGDFVAAGPAWRLLTAIAGFSGLFLITLAITYLLSVLSAVVTRRALAGQIHGLGTSAQGILVHGWSGKDFSSAFVQQLVTLSGQLSTTAQQHLAYPVLHYFHSRDPQSSMPVALARLDDAMLLLEAAVAPSARPGTSAVLPVRRGIGTCLAATMSSGAVPGVDTPPPAPDHRALAEAGIPLGDPDEFTRQVGAQADRRRQVKSLVLADGWSWPEGSREGRP